MTNKLLCLGYVVILSTVPSHSSNTWKLEVKQDSPPIMAELRSTPSPLAMSSLKGKTAPAVDKKKHFLSV